VRGADFKSVGGLSPQLFDSAFVASPITSNSPRIVDDILVAGCRIALAVTWDTVFAERAPLLTATLRFLRTTLKLFEAKESHEFLSSSSHVQLDESKLKNLVSKVRKTGEKGKEYRQTMPRPSPELVSVGLLWLCIVTIGIVSCVDAENREGVGSAAVDSPRIPSGTNAESASLQKAADGHPKEIVPPVASSANDTTAAVVARAESEKGSARSNEPKLSTPTTLPTKAASTIPVTNQKSEKEPTPSEEEDETVVDVEESGLPTEAEKAPGEPLSEEFDFDRWEAEFKRRAQQLQAEAELLAATMNHRKDPSLSEEEQNKLSSARRVQERVDDLTRELGVSRQRLIFEATKKMSALIGRRNKAFARLPAFWYTAMKDYLPENFFLTPNPAELEAALASVENDKSRVRQGKVPLSPRGSAPIIDAVLDAQAQESRLQTDQEVFAQFLQEVQCLYLPYDAVAHGETSGQNHHDDVTSEFVSQSKALPEWARRSIVASVDDDDLDDADFALNVKQKAKLGRVEGSAPAADNSAPSSGGEEVVKENEVALPAEFQHKLTEKLHLHSVHDRYRLVLRFRDRAPRLRWGVDPLDPAQDLCPQGYARRTPSGGKEQTQQQRQSQPSSATVSTTTPPEPWVEGSLKGDPFLESGGTDAEDGSLLFDHFPLSQTELVQEVSTGSGGIWDGIQSASPPMDDHGRPHRRLSLYHTTINLKEDQVHLKVHLFNRTFFRAFLPVEEFQAMPDDEQKDLQEQLRALVEYACHQSAGDPLVRYENRMLERKWRIEHKKHRQTEDEAAKRESEQRKKLFPPSADGGSTTSGSASVSLPADDHEFIDDGAEDAAFTPPPLQQQGVVDQPEGEGSDPEL
jgi:hypothetical protein